MPELETAEISETKSSPPPFLLLKIKLALGFMVNATCTNSGGNSRCNILMGRCYLLGLCMATPPSTQQVIRRSPAGE